VFFARKREIVVALPQDLAGVRVSEVHPIDLEISDMKKGLDRGQNRVLTLICRNLGLQCQRVLIRKSRHGYWTGVLSWTRHFGGIFLTVISQVPILIHVT
jgi:hypothetical protein